MNREASGPEAESSLMEHLLELRTRLVRGLAGTGLILLALLPFVRQLYDHLARPLISQLPAGQATQMIASDPTSGFFAPIKLAFFTALFLSSPWLLFQAWSFVAPGLYRHEKRLAMPLLVSAIVLFYAGCAFAYFLVLPSVFHALTVFTPDIVTLAPDPAKHLDFVMVIFLAFGVSFELPVALVIMVLLGWVTPGRGRQNTVRSLSRSSRLASILTRPLAQAEPMFSSPATSRSRSSPVIASFTLALAAVAVSI